MAEGKRMSRCTKVSKELVPDVINYKKKVFPKKLSVHFLSTSKVKGSLLGERMQVSKGAEATGRSRVWKENDWNPFRIRMVGDVPHITLWINGVQMWDVKEPKNDFIAGATSGMIALQSHWTALFSPATGEWNGLESWAPAAKHQYLQIAIRELDHDLQE
jgi:hypothetical protein